MAYHSSFKPFIPSTWLLPVINLWHWLIIVPPDMSGPKQRRTRFLAIILITFIIVATTTAIVGFFRHFILSEMLLLVIPTVFYTIAYVLNRSKHNALAAGLTIATVFMVVFASAMTQHNSILLGFVLIALFLTSMFFKMPYSILVYIVTMIGIIFVPRLFPEWYFSYYSHLTFLIGIVGILTVFTAAISQRDINQIDKQSHSLSDEISERLQIEAELQKSRDELEIRVADRTADLDGLNIELHAELNKKEKVELALKKSEELYRTLIEAAEEAIFIIDKTYCIEYVNSFGAHWLKRTMEDIIGQPVLSLFPKEIGKQLNINNVFETGKPVWAESGTPFSGGMKWLNTGLFPLKDDKGTTYAVLGFSRDISERKQLEDELRIKEERFRSIYENAVEGIFQSTLDGGYLHVNNAMAHIFGYETPDEMITLVGHDIGHKVHQSPESYTQFLDLLKKENEIKGYESLNLRKDGSQIWTSTNVRLVTKADNEDLYTEGFLIDISKRKQIEYALSASDKRFRSLFENAPISLWEEDFTLIISYFDELRRSGVTNFRDFFESHPEAVANCAAKVKIIKVNKATLELYKAKSNKDFIESIDKVFCEESFPVFKEELIALAEGKAKFDGEAINLTLTGERIHVALSLIVASNSYESAHRVFVSISDITKYKLAEQTIRQDNERIGQAVTELGVRNREMVALTEMGDLFQACQTSAEIYSVIAKYASKLFVDDESGSLAMFTDSRDSLNVVARWGQVSEMELTFSPNDCWALRLGKMYIANSIDSGMSGNHLHQLSPSASLCTPLVAQGEIMGVVSLIKSKLSGPYSGIPDVELEPFSEVKIRLITAFTEHIGLALANLKLRDTLRHQAIRDPLTNLFNRRYMEETFEREIKHAERKGTSLGIIMVDIDHFKQFNDTYGHEAGDIILFELGNFFQAHIRAEDVACRYGGEEFIIILPDSSLSNTVKRAEDLREGAKRLNVNSNGNKLGSITLSLGVSIFPEHGHTSESLLWAADQALYRAKAEGRDQVAISS